MLQLWCFFLPGAPAAALMCEVRCWWHLSATSLGDAVNNPLVQAAC
jgi:hypothetical protein